MIKKIMKVIGIVLVASIVLIGCSSPEEEVKEEEVVMVEKEEEQGKEDLSEVSEEGKEAIYLNHITYSSNVIGNGFNELGELTTNTDITDEWMIEVAGVIAEIKIEAEEVLEYNEVPERYKDVDIVYKKAMEEYIKGLDKFVESVDNNFNSEMMKESINYIDLGNEYTGNALQELEKIE